MSLVTQNLMTREDMLRELELLPVWQLRDAFAGEGACATIQPMLVAQAPSPALRLLVSEEAAYAFILADSVHDNAQEVNTLLQNMLKATKVNGHVDMPEASLQQLTERSPKLIVAMGEVAANILLGKSLTMAEWRNLQMATQIQYEATRVVVTYHPAHLLQHVADKAKAWDDLCAAKTILQNLQFKH